MRNNRQIGTEYEQRAANWLEYCGYEIICRNFRCPFGEIDIIARQGSCLVFIEVKYRSSRKNGYPEEAVSREKQRRISRTADYYRVKAQVGEEIACRFDVMAMEKEAIRYYENAFAYVL